MVRGCGLGVTSCGLRVAGYELRVQPRATYALLRLPCFLFLIGRDKYDTVELDFRIFDPAYQMFSSIELDHRQVCPQMPPSRWQYMSCARSSPIDPLQIVKNWMNSAFPSHSASSAKFERTEIEALSIWSATFLLRLSDVDRTRKPISRTKALDALNASKSRKSFMLAIEDYYSNRLRQATAEHSSFKCRLRALSEPATHNSQLATRNLQPKQLPHTRQKTLFRLADWGSLWVALPVR